MLFVASAEVSSLITRTLAFFAIFFAIFGPKLGGVVDLSLLAVPLGLLCLVGKQRVSLSAEILIVVGFVCAVAIYAVLVSLAYGAIDLQVVLRHFRALVSTCALSVIFYNVGRLGILSVDRFTRSVHAVLLIGAVFVLVGILSPSIKQLMADLYGFDKRMVPLRSAGLTAGYDTAGYLCAAGAFLAASLILMGRGSRYFLTFTVFLAATVFTSRTSMV
ncbi:MAG: hypothetical protein AAF290_06075, partial [Pseudomonadota bacterium]